MQLHKRIRISLDAPPLTIEKFDNHVEEILKAGWTLNSVVPEQGSLTTWLYYIFTREPLKTHSYTGPR